MKVYVLVSKYNENDKPRFTTDVFQSYGEANDAAFERINKIIGEDYVFDREASTTRVKIVRKVDSGWLGRVTHRFVITENEL